MICRVILARWPTFRFLLQRSRCLHISLRRPETGLGPEWWSYTIFLAWTRTPGVTWTGSPRQDIWQSRPICFSGAKDYDAQFRRCATIALVTAVHLTILKRRAAGYPHTGVAPARPADRFLHGWRLCSPARAATPICSFQRELRPNSRQRRNRAPRSLPNRRQLWREGWSSAWRRHPPGASPNTAWCRVRR